MSVMGALFVAGGAFEAALLLSSIAFGLKWGSYRPAPAAFIALLVVGVVAAAATAGLGRAMWRTNVLRSSTLGTPAASGPTVVEARAALALIFGVAAVVLIWPVGILLGPAAFWVGIAAVRRINAAAGRLVGRGRAEVGAVMGAAVCGMYLFVVVVEVVAIFMFGAPIPAAP